MNHSLRVTLCRSITARAHLAGAEAAELERQARAARRRCWRELVAAQLLLGHRWEATAYEAETGKCWDCKGTGQVWAGWSKADGTRYRDCQRCSATGNAPSKSTSEGD